MGDMQRRGLVACLSAAVLSLGACGTAAPGTASSPRPAGAGSTGQDPATPDGTPRLEPLLAPPAGPTFPLTVRRTGGIAGFHDTIVIRANGTIMVDTRDIHGRTCTLAQGDRSSLLAALSTLQLDGPTTPVPDPTDSSDPITLTVTDGQARPVDIADPSLGEIRSRVSALVADVTLTVPAMTRCTNPTR